jgi:hypothetical protein
MTMVVPRAFLAKDKVKAQPQTYQQPGPESTPQDALQTHSVDNVSRSDDVADAEKDQSLLNKLDYETWLPFAAKTYNISPKIEDYIIVSTLVCPSDIPNRNGIAFPAAELAKFQAPPISRMAYKAWQGCPVHFEHDNEVHERAYGVIWMHRCTKFRATETVGSGKC